MKISKRKCFSNINNWVFDLDNTLYDRSICLFDKIEIKMTNFIVRKLNLSPEKAQMLRSQYRKRYGTTLAGLMYNNEINPGEFLNDVHDIDLTVLSPDLELGFKLNSLPGRKIIFTNGTSDYAKRVIKHLGIADIFESIYGIEEVNYIPKPNLRAFENFYELDGLNPKNSAMFEDEERNLYFPKKAGMTTILIAPQCELEISHVDFCIKDLKRFICQVTRKVF